ncbi:glycosyltransferase family 2 protein [Streptomyces avicenniae]|uniref:glycosyltransferase family 2 protein n=1 Tax=Streptomyces avicenniae TaxID=500153 RepID=UPI000699B6E6|nr:glycosyltransferase [Streptomyces avicenniae]
MPHPSLAVVIATRNRAAKLAATLERLVALPEDPEILVVDNASTDDTRAMVADRFPHVGLLPMPDNLGPLARNAGVRALRQPYIAFSDDDSWWTPGSLTEAARLLDDDPRIGLLAARTLVGADRAPDPVNSALAASPLSGPAGLPGPPVLGFLGCAAVARRSAYLAAGGYHPLLFIGGEETLLAYDLTVAGWLVTYAPEITAVHEPADDPRPERRAMMRRNANLTAWLRRPLPVALRDTWQLAREAPADATARQALGQIVSRLPAAWRDRRPLPPEVEADVRLLERTHAAA